VIDLSPTLSPKLPVTSPGIGTGQHRQVYLKVDFLYSEYLDLWHHTHLMDAMAGTHLVPPSFALPPPGAQPAYAPEVRGWLAEYEEKYGPRGTSSLTTEQVPLDWTCGPLRVVDVRPLVGSTQPKSWPASPEITPAHIEADEQANGELRPGAVVLFYTGHLDKHLRPQPHDSGVWSDPLQGKSEGWPAPGPDAIVYLKSKGIRCVATDAPDLGGVDPKRALMTYWALGSREMVGVEFLHNAGQIPSGKNPYFLFAALKIRDCHGGPGRAIVLY
jgi:kynurenine formamidase